MRYGDLTTEQTKALLDAIRDLPEGWRDLDDGDLLARLTGGGTDPVTTDPAPDADPTPDPDPAPEGETDPVVIEPTPQGVFRFSVPTSGWGAESYRVHWGDESADVENGRGDSRATLAAIESALEGLDGIRDVEVTAPGPSGMIEGTGGRPYLVNVLDAAPGSLRVEKGNGKKVSVRVVDDEPAPADPDPGGDADPGPGAPTGPTTLVFEYSTFLHPYTRILARPREELITPPGEVFGHTWEPDWDLYFTAYIPMGDLLRPDGPFDANLGPNAYRATQAYQSQAPSRIEAALEGLPNVATAEVVSLQQVKENPEVWAWRIEITAGPGGIDSLDIGGYVLINNEYWNDFTATAYPRSLGAAQFSFDAVTSGALTPSATAAMDMGIAEGDGATDPLLADPPAAWQMGIDGGFDGNLHLDYIGA